MRYAIRWLKCKLKPPKNQIQDLRTKLCKDLDFQVLAEHPGAFKFQQELWQFQTANIQDHAPPNYQATTLIPWEHFKFGWKTRLGGSYRE